MSSRLVGYEDALARAREEAGLTDFGDLPFEDGLKRLLQCAEQELSFSESGEVAFASNVQRWLVNRLRYVDTVKRQPGILAEDVSDPIIIIGMPRSGTTKMQRLLSSAPGTLPLPMWMTLNPAPFPGEALGTSAQRVAYARALQAAQAADNPDFLASHERTAEEAEEDSDLLLFSLDYLMLYIIHPSDAYLEWLRARPRLPAYDLQHRLLQFLQWQCGGRQGRRWVLKNPGHIGQMDALTDVYPKATLLHLHRDLREVLPSYCRLLQSIYEELFVSVDPHRIGRETLAYWGPEFKRQQQQREALADRLNIQDVPYSAVINDAQAIAEQTFARAGMPVTNQMKDALANWQAGNAQHKHGRPAYSLEEYGLDEDAILAAFGTFDDDTSLQNSSGLPA